ncbi:CGH_3_HP_G0030950.mRNA.1.CDS.1 [Saccharomyces cerevisiae]|nr:CGH_3_HP_G0030950.mRNA.1.CDS.1 [Saccharomyces cerevisiae]CAI6466824.1 CGH_3_HP_G0030950.mRNA.1.CDS.1 [Saccharomyces cerevisiae]
MSLSNIFNPIPAASPLMGLPFSWKNPSVLFRTMKSPHQIKNVGHLRSYDITFRANEGEVVLVLETQHQRSSKVYSMVTSI